MRQRPGAAALVDRATVYDSVADAIGELNFVLASTARPRGMVKPVLSPARAASELKRRGARAERTGVLFGPERSGLDNDTIALADAILTAPVNPEFASLSLPQAVLLFGYEWFKTTEAEPSLGRGTAFDGPAAEGLDLPGTRPARRAELIGLFEHLESELDRAGFLYPEEKRPTMVRAIRNMFHRMSDRPGRSHLAWDRRLAQRCLARDAGRKRHSSAPFLLLRWPQPMISFRAG